VLVTRRAETVPSQAEVEREACRQLKRILHEQTQFAVAQRAIGNGIETRAGKRKTQQKVRVPGKRSVKGEAAVCPLRNKAAEARLRFVLASDLQDVSFLGPGKRVGTLPAT